MIQNNTYQSEFIQSPAYMAGRPYQNRFYQSQSYQNRPSYWNQSGIPGAYYRGNPQINHSVYGAAFATLPADLGGKLPGNRSQFSGVPNW